MEFLPLHVYTGYSFLKSGMSLSRYVAAAKKRGLTAIGLSDFHSLTGLPEFTSLCQEAGIKPFYGMDLTVEGLLFSCYIVDEIGYRNLLHILLLLSQGRLSLDALKSLQKGLRFVLDCSSPLLVEKYENNEEGLRDFLAKLNKGIDFLALGLPYLPYKKRYVDFLRSFCKTYPYPLLAFPHIRYIKPEDAIALSIVEAIATDGKLEESERSGDQYFLSDEEISAYYEEAELRASASMNEGITFQYAQKRGALPSFPNNEGLTSEELLRREAYAGLSAKVPNFDEAHHKRLEYELTIIEQMGYASYFLIVADYVRFAKTHGISVGPGRGSGAGSLVSFALGIVSPDPLKYDLLFERFLNPERQSMPDIDVDFADVRRDEVAFYLQEKYGHSRVAHIVTLQTLGAKASIRDVGRVFNYEPRHIDMLAKSIGQNNDSLRENYKKNAQFRSLVDSDPYYLKIVSLASKIEGLPRQAGLHAAGIVLSEEPLEDVVPVMDNPGIGYVAQYEMNYLEEQGVLKMDLLGLRNLTLVDHCIDLIASNRGLKLDYASIPYEDEAAIRLIASGKTMGLFQLESPGMNRAIATVRPTSFSDVVAIIALFRPGPMENIPSFARRKAGREPITYPSPLLEPILKETYGVIVYQEQIMQIVRAMAGFSYGEADVFRRAVSKKDAAKLGSLKSGFMQGCAKQGVDVQTSERVFDLIYKFANYGFNKSHALVYAILACQMAYLKSRYPLEFYCSILDGTSVNDSKFPALVNEIKTSGVHFALPSVNKAHIRFVPEGDVIRFPLTAIKGMQGLLAAKIVDEREQNGLYLDFFDFAVRNKKNGLNLTSLVRLVDAGCFDDFGIGRASLRLASEPAISYAEMFSGPMGNEILLGLNFPKPEISIVHEDILDDLLAERECLGLMISGSPLASKKDIIKAEKLHRLSELPSLNYEANYAGVVSSVKAVVTKKGTRMAFLTLYDEESVVEVALFAEVYDQAYPLLKEGTLVKASIYKNRSREGYCASRIEAL